MDLANSYFSITSPWQVVDRWLHPFCHHLPLTLRDTDLQLSWTHRAQRQLDKRSTPLYLDLQLYFSCVVQKRVLFSETPLTDSLAANQQIYLRFRALQAEACDPQIFAHEHPVQRELTSSFAQKMAPSQLYLDYRRSDWWGSFDI